MIMNEVRLVMPLTPTGTNPTATDEPSSRATATRHLKIPLNAL